MMSDSIGITMDKIEVRANGEIVIKDARLAEAIKNDKSKKFDPNTNLLDYKCQNTGCL